MTFLSVAGIDVDPLHLGRVGVLHELLDLGSDHPVDRVTDTLDIADLEPEPGQHVSEPLNRGLVGRVGEVPVLVQPGQQDLHVCVTSKWSTDAQAGIIGSSRERSVRVQGAR